MKNLFLLSLLSLASLGAFGEAPVIPVEPPVPPVIGSTPPPIRPPVKPPPVGSLDGFHFEDFGNGALGQKISNAVLRPLFYVLGAVFGLLFAVTFIRFSWRRVRSAVGRSS